MEFIRPMVEERFAKMEEFGVDWDDKPVRLSTSLMLRLYLCGGTERHAHVAHE